MYFAHNVLPLELVLHTLQPVQFRGQFERRQQRVLENENIYCRRQDNVKMYKLKNYKPMYT